MKNILIFSLLLTNFFAYSQIEKLSGPRVGITFITEGQISDYINEGLDFDEDENKGYGNTGFSYTTQYGWQWETKFSDGGNIVGIVEWVALIAGLEKGMFLPSASSLVGIRSSKGFECAFGPNLSLSGVAMALALGYNFKSGNLNIPVNLAFVPSIKKEGNYIHNGNVVEYGYSTGSRISLIVGFNMNKKSSK